MGEPTSRNGDEPIPEHIGDEEATRGTETSKYPEEEKANRDSLSSGERTGNSLNRYLRVSGSWGVYYGVIKKDHS